MDWENMDEDNFYRGIYRDVQDSGASGWYIRKSHKLLEKGFSKIPQPKILEVGGNIGEHIQFVHEDFTSYTLTDYRPTGFVSQNDLIKFEIADVQNLPFQNDLFDRTISTCLLHHLDDPKKALEEMRRVTAHNGLISILVPCDPGLAYRLAKRLGPARKWKAAGIPNPSFYHYAQHRNHFPGIASIIQEVFNLDKTTTHYWPFGIKSWNVNLFTTNQIRVSKRGIELQS
jgi:phosphatidylethanolamine/phosphatidyl-N-methylethanolamine N-methyltransferase